MQYSYAIFLLCLLLVAAKLKYDQVGLNDWNMTSYLKAQEKIKKKLERRERIRKKKKEAEKQLDEMESKDDKKKEESEDNGV